MGTSKALLPVGAETMLQRVVRLVSEVVPAENIVVVAAAEQRLPTLSSRILLAQDGHENRGPLEGLAAGLERLAERVDAVYATGCDVPQLVPAFIERVFELLGDHDIVVPADGKFRHPLAAVYRMSVLAHVRQLLAANRLRPVFLFQQLDTREIPIDDLRTVDPNLATLENINRPEDYLKTLQALGLKPTDGHN